MLTAEVYNRLLRVGYIREVSQVIVLLIERNYGTPFFDLLAPGDAPNPRFGSRGCAAYVLQVFCVRRKPEVIGVNAFSVPAHVIDLPAGRYRPEVEFV